MDSLTNNDYHKQTDIRTINTLRTVISELPGFCYQYFTALSTDTSPLTRLNYAYDLRTFFEYLTKETLVVGGKKITEISEADLNEITAENIDSYMEYLTLYFKSDENSGNKLMENSAAGKARKLSAVKSLFGYLYKRGKIDKDITRLVATPKQYEKPIIRLDADEVQLLMNTATTGEGLTERQAEYAKNTRLRDTAILTTFLTTGMRISECVGINISDIDFKEKAIRIRRKGGNYSLIYMGDELEQVLQEYLLERKLILPAEGNEDALFLSTRKCRISVRAVENLVKKYASAAVPLKHITPHKLRSTYGTALYHETGDIYLVADVLGHKDINTTKKHYAAMSEDRRKAAANVVRINDATEHGVEKDVKLDE